MHAIEEHGIQRSVLAQRLIELAQHVRPIHRGLDVTDARIRAQEVGEFLERGGLVVRREHVQQLLIMSRHDPTHLTGVSAHAR